MSALIRATIRKSRSATALLRRKRILTRRKYLAGSALFNLAFLLVIATRLLSHPNTMVGTRNVGLKTRGQVQKTIEEAYASPVTLTLREQSFDTTLSHLGVYIDTPSVIAEVFAPNRLPFPGNLLSFAGSFVSRRTIASPLLFSQEFYAYVDKINTAGAENTEIVYMDQDKKSITYISPHQGYIVDTARLTDLLLKRFGSNSAPVAVPLLRHISTKEETVLTANTMLSSAYGNPLTVIIVLNGANRFITLSPEDLRKYSLAQVSAETGTVTFDLEKEIFLADVQTALAVYGEQFNRDAVARRIGEQITMSLRSRFEGNPVESVTVYSDEGPNTDGSKWDKYIEVDISQQKLFTFEGGTLQKTYRVSTGRDYPTPTGEFSIQNKIGLGYSKIYDVWMPYWMGFTYSDELQASFGIHELPFYYSEDQRVQRPREFIGAPNTGGCVALDIGDSKEVYEFADIGTPLVIYP